MALRLRAGGVLVLERFRYLQPRLDRAMLCDLRGEFRAHEPWVGDDADAAKVEAVSVPAGADGGVFVVVPVRVPDAGFVEEFEVPVGQVEELSAQGLGQFGAAGAVVGISEVVDPLAVMKQGEEAHYGHDGPGSGRKDQAIALHPPPMVGPMHGVWMHCPG